MATNRQIPPATVEEALGKLQEIFRRIRSLSDQAEELASALALDDLDLLRGKQSLELTAGGTIKGLSAKIVGLLEEMGQPLTTDEIARLLYKPAYNMSTDLFKRRVIVTVSAMYKKEAEPRVVPAKQVGPGKEKLWTLPALQAQKELFVSEEASKNATGRLPLVNLPGNGNDLESG